MSAGEIQLAALGMQDVYLTGSPQVSYFNGVYKRHTPFSVQSFQIPFENPLITWGSQAICRVPFKGDMIQSATLAVTLPALYPYSVKYRWKLPVQAQVPQIYLYINGNQFLTSAGTQTFFIVPSPPWLGTALSANVGYSSSLGQFYIQSSTTTPITSVSINTSDVTTVGLFWGLDPYSFSTQTTALTTWNYKNGNFFDFTVDQAGWTQFSSTTSDLFSATLLYLGPASTPVDLTTSGAYNQRIISSGTGQLFTAPFLNINFSGFLGGVKGIGGFFSNTAGTYNNFNGGGNIQFSYPGSYAVILTLSGVGAPTRIGIGHTSTDFHPTIITSYDYVYTFNVQFSSPRIILPVFVSDVSQFYFVDIETTSLTAIDATSEIILTDVNEFWIVNSNCAISNNTLILSSSGITRNSLNQQIVPNVASNTFNFTSTGLFNLYGTISVGAANTISSVSLVEQQLIGTKVGNVISQWNSPQASSPSVNFTLPVQVLDYTNNNYSIIVQTTDVNPLGNAIALTSLTIESFGSASNVPLDLHQNDFKQNGLLLTSKVTNNYSLGLANVNVYSTMNSVGSSYGIKVTPGGNLSLGNVSNYRISTYFETSNAYVSNVSIWSASSDAGTFSQLATRSIPLGLSGGYPIDLIVPVTAATISSVYQIRVGLSNSAIGQTTTNVTANAYFTVLGITGQGSANTYTYVDSVGTYLVDSAELRIGGQTIQTLTGEMIEFYNDLVVTQENQPGLTLLTGKNDKSTRIYNDRVYYVNLPFFFYGNAELSLPICALPLQDLEIWVNFHTFQPLLNSGASLDTPSSIQTSIIIDYAYVTDSEVDWFLKHRQDYLIRQIQYDTFKMNGSLTFSLDFQGPVRELFFVIHDSADSAYTYTTDQALGVGIRFNGEDFIDGSTMDYHFTRFIAPLNCYARQPDHTIHMIPLCRDPLNPRPTGSINMSRIKEKFINFYLPNITSLDTKTLRIMAVSYNVLRVENGLAGIMYQ
jgi:hypothetical protein